MVSDRYNRSRQRNRRMAVAALLTTLLLLVTPGVWLVTAIQALEPGALAVRQWISGWWPWSSPAGRGGALPIDKLVHFLMFFVCAILVARAWVRESIRILPMLWLIAFGALTELVQYLIPGRSMSFYDFVADAVGVVAGFLLWYAIRRRNPIS